MHDEELTVSETAERLGVSRSTVLRLVTDDELDARKRTRNGPWYVDVQSIRDYEDSLDGDDDDGDELEQAHLDGYREGRAEAALDDDDADEDDDVDDDEDDDDLDDSDDEDDDLD